MPPRRQPLKTLDPSKLKALESLLNELPEHVVVSRIYTTLLIKDDVYSANSEVDLVFPIHVLRQPKLLLLENPNRPRTT